MRGLDNISLPENIKEVTLKAIDRAENQKKKKKKHKIKAIVASIVTCFIIGSAAGNDMVSASISNMMHKMETFFNGDLKEDVIKDYKSSIGITKEDKGVKVTLNEFFMDNENLYINTRFESRDGKDFAQGGEYKVLLNGKNVAGGNSAGTSFEYNNDNSVDMLSTRNMDKVDLKSIKDVTVVFSEVTYKDDKLNKETVNGNWEFNFKFDGEKVASTIQDIDINKTINLKKTDIKVHSLKVTPMNFSIDFEFIKGIGEVDFDKGRTAIGVLNDKGELIESDDGGGGTILTTDIMVDTKNMKEVTIVPYTRLWKKNFFGKDKIIYRDKAFKVSLTK